MKAKQTKEQRVPRTIDRLNVVLKHFGIEEYRKPYEPGPSGLEGWFDSLTPEEQAEVSTDVACSEDAD